MSSALNCFDAPLETVGGRTPRVPYNLQSITVRPGEPATPESFSHAREREELLKLVRRFLLEGLSWHGGQAASISELTQQTAEKFFRTLPAGKAFPKVSPDGEGGLMLIWASPQSVLITVDDLKLHMVVAAATAQAEYLNDIVLGELIDNRILNAIPAR